MSFFNSLQQYVSDSVANLSLSPKRFSFSREDSTQGGSGRSGSTGSVTSTTNTVTQQTTPHGFPKVRARADSRESKAHTFIPLFLYNTNLVPPPGLYPSHDPLEINESSPRTYHAVRQLEKKQSFHIFFP